MSKPNQVSIVLGEEFDDALRSKLLAVLQPLGARVAGSDGRVIGGSQELEELDVLIGGQPLRIEAETDVGLSITGSDELVLQIRQMIDV